LPFKCPYCGQYFCAAHRLPENHGCPEIWRARAPKKELVTPVDTKIRRPRTYTTTYELATPSERVIWFSKTELKHLAAGALLVLAVGFSIYFYPSLIPVATALAVIFTASFLTHELAHKITAQLQGLWAEFRIIPFGAVLTIISIFTPFFKIISPGAVVTAGFADREKLGKTALAGPLANLGLAALFIVVMALSWSESVRLIATFSAWINSFMALFNLVPFGIIDGLKVFWWDKKVWLAAFAVSLVLAVYVGAQVIYV